MTAGQVSLSPRDTDVITVPLSFWLPMLGKKGVVGMGGRSNAHICYLEAV